MLVVPRKGNCFSPLWGYHVAGWPYSLPLLSWEFREMDWLNTFQFGAFEHQINFFVLGVLLSIVDAMFESMGASIINYVTYWHGFSRQNILACDLRILERKEMDKPPSMLFQCHDSWLFSLVWYSSWMICSFVDSKSSFYILNLVLVYWVGCEPDLCELSITPAGMLTLSWTPWSSSSRTSQRWTNYGCGCIIRFVQISRMCPFSCMDLHGIFWKKTTKTNA